MICALAQISRQAAREEKKRFVIAAGRLLDGRGHVLRDTRVVVEGSRLSRLILKAGPIDYDLRGFTVMPGWIDAHVHITWSFGPDGRNAGPDATTQFAAYQSRLECVEDSDGRVHHRAERRLPERLRRCGTRSRKKTSRFRAS